MKVVTLNAQMFDEANKQLVALSPSNPDLIISVLNGGGYLINSMIKQGFYPNTPIVSVKLQRSSTKKKDKKLFTLLLQLLPYKLLDILRVFESNKIKKTFEKRGNSRIDSRDLQLNNSDIKLLKKARKIMIIDDAIDTGVTVWRIKNEIEKHFTASPSVFISVISWTIRSSKIKPNAFIYRDQLVWFPWSKDYKGRDFEN